ncbi:hypothetical protein Sjap_017978 [Stephania japonica]|uniref:Peripheral subunit-binding (PSBD) domain-containing protein n=1 Tax=Stephania japonica TaxID=461633 RepID=A0AAP0I751_9MAGN
MVDLEGQDHGPSSSSVGDNDDDFIVYSKEDNATVAMECTEEVFLAKIIHGDGAKVIKVGEVNATTVEDEDDIGKFKDYKPSQLGDSKEAKVPSDPSPPTPPKKEDTEPVSSAEPKKPKVANAPQSGSRIFASPLARKLANDHNLPLSKIKGTGSDGTIVQADIEDYLGTSILLLSSSIVLLTVFDSNCERLQSRLNSLKEASGGQRISVNDLVIKAAALALCKVPQCNSSWTDEYIRQYHSVNVAVQTEHGLFVPVVRDADKKGLSKIADEVKSFTQKAKENSLKPEDYKGGTFTVSNLGGTYGIQQFCAIINPPQSGILAVGSVEKRDQDNATVAMECTEEVFLANIIHGDGAKVIKVGEVNATTVEDEDDIAKFKYYKPSQLGYSKEAKVPSDPSPPTPPKKEDTEPVSSAEPKKPKVVNAPQSGSLIFGSPLARKLANNHNVPLSKIKGTGSDGTIVQADIEDYLGTSILLLSSSIVLLTVFDSNCERVASELKSQAAALALCKVPQCNSSWTDEYIRQYHSVNVAVQTEHGLFVPVVRKAKENSLKPEEYEGGTFTVSNLGGTYGIKQFCAIINPPQSGILAVEISQTELEVKSLRVQSHHRLCEHQCENTRDVIMGILLTESLTSSRMLITTEVVPCLLEASMSMTKPPLS